MLEEDILSTRWNKDCDVKVVQAHTLGEVGILGAGLLRFSSGTILPIFIKIGSYLTDREQKNKLAQFFWHTVYIL